MIDSGKQSSCDGDFGFSGTAPLFEDLILGKDFRMPFGARVTCRDRTLNKQWLEVLSSFANASCLLLVGTLIILRRKTCPGTKVLGRFELLHIGADFTDYANGSHGVGDAGDGKQQFDLAGIRFCKLKNKLPQSITKVVKIGDVLADQLKFLRLPGRENPIHRVLNLLR